VVKWKSANTNSTREVNGVQAAGSKPSTGGAGHGSGGVNGDRY
jgi:hypothetical protein